MKKSTLLYQDENVGTSSYAERVSKIVFRGLSNDCIDKYVSS